jgi:hypothetical protein
MLHVKRNAVIRGTTLVQNYPKCGARDIGAIVTVPRLAPCANGLVDCRVPKKPFSGTPSFMPIRN